MSAEMSLLPDDGALHVPANGRDPVRPAGNHHSVSEQGDSFCFFIFPFGCVLSFLKEGVSARPSLCLSIRHTRVEFLRNGLSLSETKIASGT